MNRSDIQLPQLLEMIERYFDCLLTDEEESRLRSLLATTTLSHPAIEEAKALMGFRKPKRETKRRILTSPKRWRPIASVAAASVIVAIGTIFLIREHSSLSMGNSTCIAYINGSVITDEAEVLRQLTADMREFGDCAHEAQMSLSQELDETIPLIEEYESSPIADKY